MKSSVVLDKLQWNMKWVWDSSCSQILGHTKFVELPILWIQGLKRVENELIQKKKGKVEDMEFPGVFKK